MNRVYSFESLEAWKDARELVKWIYKVTANFPNEERFGIVSQIRRASISVVSHLEEGSSRKSTKDQAHFTQISYSSLLEVLNHLIISSDLGLINDPILQEGRIVIEALTGKVGGLRNSQLSKIN